MSLLQDRLNAVKEEENPPIQPSLHIKENIPPKQESLIFEPPHNFLNPFLCRQKKEEKTIMEMERENPFVSEELLEAETIKRQREEAHKEAKNQFYFKMVNGFLVTACIYIIFLIYGVLMTDYCYDEKGKIAPQVLSVSDIKEKKEFDVILVQYERCRSLYEKVLILDYRLGQGVENPMSLAPQYEVLLDDVENLSIKTDALDISTQYDQIKSMLLSWIQNDMAVYLQTVSSAISQNNSEDASIAIAYKSSMYDNFSLITSNLVVMGEKINGVDMNGIKKWSPEAYVDNTINGEKNE